MFLFYTKSSLDDYSQFVLQGGMFLCKEAIVSSIDDHQEFCDGTVWYSYYALDAQLFQLWHFYNDEWHEVGLPCLDFLDYLSSKKVQEAV